MNLRNVKDSFHTFHRFPLAIPPADFVKKSSRDSSKNPSQGYFEKFSTDFFRNMASDFFKNLFFKEIFPKLLWHFFKNSFINSCRDSFIKSFADFVTNSSTVFFINFPEVAERNPAGIVFPLFSEISPNSPSEIHPRNFRGLSQ